MRALKIARHTFFQVAGFARIDDLALGVQHAVDTRAVRQAPDERLRIERPIDCRIALLAHLTGRSSNSFARPNTA
jgi:hypothetical protein